MPKFLPKSGAVRPGISGTLSILQRQIAELEKSAALLELLVSSSTVTQRIRYFKICQDTLPDSSLMRILNLSEKDFK